MQINELGKNRTNINGISDAPGKTRQKGQGEGICKTDRNKVAEESFQDSLQKSMNAENRAEAAVQEINSESGWPDHTRRPDCGAISHKDTGFGANKAEGISIRVERGREPAEVKEVEVRRLSYSECDKVEINVLEGYTLKAKLEADEAGDGAGGCRIYVEMKDEEGTMKACLFNGAGLQKDSRNVMERIAYAAVYDREEI